MCFSGVKNPVIFVGSFDTNVFPISGDVVVSSCGTVVSLQKTWTL